MTWQEDLELKMRLVSRKDQRIENLNVDTNDLIDEIQAICDANDVDEYSTQFAKVVRTGDKVVEYRRHDASDKLDAVSAAYPQLHATSLFTITCNNPNHYTLKATATVQTYLDGWVDEGLITSEERTAIEDMLRLYVRAGLIRVMPLKPTDPPPLWPDDDD